MNLKAIIKKSFATMQKVAVVILCMVIYMASGCERQNDSKSTDVGVTFENLASAPKNIVAKETLPEWLVVRINDYYEPRPFKVQIYKGEWNKQPVFFIMDFHSSCLCDFFTKDGERISNDSSMNIHLTSKNWVLIYECGG